MKFEILTPQDDKLTEDVLDALQGIPRCLARARPDGVDNQLLDGFLVSILKESMVRISEPQNRQAQGSIEILARMAGTSASAFRQIVPSLIEVLIKMINESDAIDKRMTCLGMLTTVLKSGVGSPIISQDYRATVLSGLKDQLFELYARCLMGTPVDRVSLRQSSIEGLLVLAAIDGLLKDSEFRICIGHLDSIILDEAPHGREAIQRTAIDALTTLAGLKAAIISEVALPKFLARLPDASRCNELSYIPILEALAQLSRERSLFEVICRRLIGRVQAIDRTPDQARFGSAMLAAIYRGLMEQKPVEGEGKSTGLEQALVEPLIRKFTESDSEDQSPWDHTLLNNLGRILSFMLSAMTLEDQKTTLTGLKLFRAPPDSSDPKELSTAWLFAGRKLKAHRLPSVQSAILAPWICAALQRSVEVSSMLECLQYLGTPSSYTAANTAAADLLEILVNKWPQYFEATAIPPIPILKPGVPGSEELGKLFRIYLQMIKGYVLRNHPSGVKLLESLLPALELPTQASSLAKAFGIILAPSQHLTRANHAVINPLHSQRLYTFLLPILSHKIRSPNTPTTSKLNHLTAFSQLVQFLPQTVLLQNIALSSPLLLQCLDLRDPGTRAATIKVLQRLLLAQPLDLESHTASIVTRLLASARLEFLDPPEVTAAAGAAAQEASPPHVRRAALKCLALMPGAMPLQTLMTVKRDVLQELRLALDDPRRSVRKEAVDCRTAWLRLDEPDEDG